MFEKDTIIAMLTRLEIDEHDDSWDISNKVRNKYDPTTCGRVKISDGASKLCFVFLDKPFVVKWSPRRCEEAMQEVEIYQRAEAENLGRFFPKTAFLACINGVNFVVQEKIDKAVADCNMKDNKRFERIGKTATDRIIRKIEHEFWKAAQGYRRSLDYNWARMAIVLYGKKACKALCQFVIDNHINDLHGNNIGYKNGKPIILDFSGYHR